MSRQGWEAPASTAVPGRDLAAEVVVPAVSWWFVSWLARVLDESTGSVESSLPLISTALDRLAAVGGMPNIHLIGPSTVLFEFWFEAGSAREACGGARAVLRQALRAAGVGDPTPPPTPGGLMLMFEEFPRLRQDES